MSRGSPVWMVIICALLSQLNPGFARAQSTDARPVPMDVELTYRRITSDFGDTVALSPDSKLVVYTVGLKNIEKVPSTRFTESGVSLSRKSFRDQQEVWITDVSSGHTVRLSSPNGTCWAPVWSPAGDRLAYYSDRDGLARIWIWDRATGETRRVSDTVVRAFFAYHSVRWSADGSTLLAKTLHPGTPMTGQYDEVRRRETGIRIREWPVGEAYSEEDPSMRVPGREDYLHADLALIDVETGRTRVVAEEALAANYWFGPQSDCLAYLSMSGKPVSNQFRQRFELRIAYLDGRESRAIATDIDGTNDLFAAGWSPDGKYFAFFDRTGDLNVVSVDGKSSKKVFPGHPVLTRHRGPLWDSSGRRIFWATREGISYTDRDTLEVKLLSAVPGKSVLSLPTRWDSSEIWSIRKGRSLVAVTQDLSTGKMGFSSIDLSTGQTSTLFEADVCLGNYFSLMFQVTPSKDGATVVFTAESSSRPQDVWFATEETLDSPRRITDLNPEIASFSMGQTRLVEWNDLDGQKLTGSLMLPSVSSGAGPYPLIVEVYGAWPSTQLMNVFEGRLQIFASRGYAVLSPDAPVQVGAQMNSIARAVIPAVNKLVETGIADRNRVGVMGRSFGGYSVLALIVQSRLFKAAVSHAGFGNLVGMYGTLRPDGTDYAIGFLESSWLGVGDSLWNARDKYIENSPSFYFERVEAAVLLTHGADDDVVPVHMSQEVFAQLRRLGKTVTLVEYEGDFHGLRKPSSVMDWNERVLAWFAKHLK